MTVAPPLVHSTPAARAYPDRTVAVAGLGYSLAWVVGLTLTSTGTTVGSTGAEVLAAASGSTGVVAAQYVVTEIVTAIALVLTLRAVAHRAGDRLIAALGAVVGGLSLVQAALGVYLALVAVPSDDAGLAGSLFQAVSRTDGVKMLLIAVLALLGARAGRRGRLPRWLTPVAVLLALTVTVSGVGYFLLVDGLALAAYASLPLLMVWVTGAGLASARRGGQEA